MRTIIKLALVALVANATFHLFVAYSSYYRFRDAVHELVQYGNERSDQRLRERVMTLAHQYDVPLRDDSFTITRENAHTIIDGAYIQNVELLPAYPYQWQFNWHVDTLTLAGLAPPRQ